jgi:hypothetical protein
VASAPEQLALLVLAHLLPALLDDAAQRLSLDVRAMAAASWLVGRRGEVNRAWVHVRSPVRGGAGARGNSKNAVLHATLQRFLVRFQFRGRNFEAHHLDFFVIVS